MANPTQRSAYQLTDVSNVKITGDILPVRYNTGEGHIARKEDLAFLHEAYRHFGIITKRSPADKSANLFGAVPKLSVINNILSNFANCYFATNDISYQRIKGTIINPDYTPAGKPLVNSYTLSATDRYLNKRVSDDILFPLQSKLANLRMAEYDFKLKTDRIKTAYSILKRGGILFSEEAWDQFRLSFTGTRLKISWYDGAEYSRKTYTYDEANPYFDPSIFRNYDSSGVTWKQFQSTRLFYGNAYIDLYNKELQGCIDRLWITYTHTSECYFDVEQDHRQSFCCTPVECTKISSTGVKTGTYERWQVPQSYFEGDACLARAAQMFGYSLEQVYNAQKVTCNTILTDSNGGLIVFAKLNPRVNLNDVTLPWS